MVGWHATTVQQKTNYRPKTWLVLLTGLRRARGGRLHCTAKQIAEGRMKGYFLKAECGALSPALCSSERVRNQLR